MLHTTNLINASKGRADTTKDLQQKALQIDRQTDIETEA
jgi:hypothetical protein